jgi:pimeloyl-ACP methyl ester carboxylesterase
MNGRENLERITLPVLDIWGEDGGIDGRFAAERRDLVSATYTQSAIRGANHSFESYEDVFTGRVIEWLRGMSGGMMASSAPHVVRQ